MHCPSHVSLSRKGTKNLTLGLRFLRPHGYPTPNAILSWGVVLDPSVLTTPDSLPHYAWPPTPQPSSDLRVSLVRTSVTCFFLPFHPWQTPPYPFVALSDTAPHMFTGLLFQPTISRVNETSLRRRPTPATVPPSATALASAPPVLPSPSWEEDVTQVPSSSFTFQPQLPDHISCAQREARNLFNDHASALMNNSRAAGTRATYHNILTTCLPPAEAALGLSLLPLTSWDDAILLFTHVLHAGPKARPPDRQDLTPSVRWSYLRSLRAAWGHWHAANNHNFLLNDTWPSHFAAFWEGLKREAFHVVTQKLPLMLEDVRRLLTDAACAVPRLQLATSPGCCFSDAKSDLILLRTAVSVAIAFFGVRRGAEVASLRLADVSISTGLQFARFSIRRQKNDQVGVGSVSCLPSMPGWGSHCPVTLLQDWLNTRSAVADAFDQFSRISKTPSLPADSAHDALFITLSGSRWGLPLSSEAFRSQLSERFTPIPYARVPSPRKGGARWYAALGTPRAVTQAQGAWKTPAVMDAIYDGFEEAEHLREIVLAASRGSDALALQDSLTALQSDAASLHLAEDTDAATLSTQLIHKLHALRHLLSKDMVSTFAPDFASRIRRLKKTARDDDKILLGDIAPAFTISTKRGHPALASTTDKAVARAAAQRLRKTVVPIPSASSDDAKTNALLPVFPGMT